MQSQGLTDTNRAICHIPVSASRSFRAGSGRPLTITMARGSISGTALGRLLTPAAVQIAPSERSGRNSSSAPECARSKVPGRSAWSLVCKSDRAGRTERAQKSGAGLPNTQPRIMTPCTATLPAHSARRTVIRVIAGQVSGSPSRPVRIGTYERVCNGLGMALGAGNDGTGRRPTGCFRRSIAMWWRRTEQDETG